MKRRWGDILNQHGFFYSGDRAEEPLFGGVNYSSKSGESYNLSISGWCHVGTGAKGETLHSLVEHIYSNLNHSAYILEMK